MLLVPSPKAGLPPRNKNKKSESVSLTKKTTWHCHQEHHLWNELQEEVNLERCALVEVTTNIHVSHDYFHDYLENPVCKLHLWLNKLSVTPKIMCATPIITDSFSLYELKNVILFRANCQIWKTKEEDHPEWMNFCVLMRMEEKLTGSIPRGYMSPL